jgi:hypothetical protein
MPVAIREGRMARKPRRARGKTAKQPNLPLSYNLAAEPGAYSLEGQPATLTHHLKASDLETAPPEIGTPIISAGSGSAAGAGAAAGVGRALRVNDAVSSTTASSPEVRASPPRRVQAKRVPRPRRRAVQTYAPATRTLVQQLINELAAKRHNDPPTGELLEALKELHEKLGEIIDRADRGKSLAPVAAALLTLDDLVGKTISKGAKIGSFLGETALLSILMSMVLGLPIDSTMAAGVMAYIAAKETTKSSERKK